MSVALLIGRFQPFHRGHERLVDFCKKRFDDAVVGIGSSGKSRTSENLLNYTERKSLIKALYPDIVVFSVKDREDDREWVEEVEEKIEESTDYSPSDMVPITRNNWTERCFRRGGYDVVHHELLEPEKYSATKIRNLIRRGDEWQYLVPEKVRSRMVEENLVEIIKEET